mmetsp:Transcript_40431/g.65162  ORF Transcript_40431/g.65162 Transcript_40431/m.65162 type:complete len:83 (-) Transcript_40431:699-947(-)
MNIQVIAFWDWITSLVNGTSTTKQKGINPNKAMMVIWISLDIKASECCCVICKTLFVHCTEEFLKVWSLFMMYLHPKLSQMT